MTSISIRLKPHQKGRTYCKSPQPRDSANPQQADIRGKHHPGTHNANCMHKAQIYDLFQSEAPGSRYDRRCFRTSRCIRCLDSTPTPKKRKIIS
jgi:hypothetical protein